MIVSMRERSQAWGKFDKARGGGGWVEQVRWMRGTHPTGGGLRDGRG